MRKAVEFLGKDVQDRLNGRFKGNEKPDDLIQWLIDAAPPIERTAYQIVERVMALNVASIHTTTMVGEREKPHVVANESLSRHSLPRFTG